MVDNKSNQKTFSARDIENKHRITALSFCDKRQISRQCYHVIAVVFLQFDWFCTTFSLKKLSICQQYYAATKQTHTLISHPFRGLLGFIPFPKAIKSSINSYFDVLLDNAFKVEQIVKYKSDSGMMMNWMMRRMEYFEMRSNKRHGQIIAGGMPL